MFPGVIWGGGVCPQRIIFMHELLNVPFLPVIWVHVFVAVVDDDAIVCFKGFNPLSLDIYYIIACWGEM